MIGAGRLGAALARALDAAGYRVTAVASASGDSARALACELSDAEAGGAEAVVEACELVFLVTPDDTISALAASLPWRPDQQAVHCSGALGLEALDAARARGTEVGCFHPLQSFPPHSDGPERFQGIVCGVEGDGALGEALEGVARDLGARPVRLDGVDRAKYHAAAVFGSNHLVALVAAASEAWAAAGLPPVDALPALLPLLRGALENVASAPDLATALTGPVARGDVSTVRAHLEALGDTPELLALYRQLSRALLDLPLALPADARRDLEALLGTSTDGGGTGAR